MASMFSSLLLLMAVNIYGASAQSSPGELISLSSSSSTTTLSQYPSSIPTSYVSTYSTGRHAPAKSKSPRTALPFLTDDYDLYPTAEFPLSPHNTGLPTGTIILIAVLVPAFVIIFLVVVICIINRRAQQKRKSMDGKGKDNPTLNNNEELNHIQQYSHLQTVENSTQQQPYDFLNYATEDSGYENEAESVSRSYAEINQTPSPIDQRYTKLQPIGNRAQQPYDSLNQPTEERGYANETQDIISGNVSEPNKTDQNPSERQQYTKLQPTENRTLQPYESLNQPSQSNLNVNNNPLDNIGSNTGYVEMSPESINSYASCMADKLNTPVTRNGVEWRRGRNSGTLKNMSRDTLYAQIGAHSN